MPGLLNNILELLEGFMHQLYSEETGKTKSPFCTDRGGHSVTVWILMEGPYILIFCELCSLRNVYCFCRRWRLSSPLCRPQRKAYYCPQAASEGLHSTDFLPPFPPLYFLLGCDSWFPSTWDWKRSPEREAVFAQQPGLLGGAKPSPRNRAHHEAPCNEKEMKQTVCFCF